MKKQILQALYAGSSTGYVSGQQLCETLGVTRQAVWKTIKQLKEYGYQIESVPKKGYRLLEAPEHMMAEDIACRFSKENICHYVEYYDEVDSTNLRVKQLAEQGAEEGTLVVADCQTAGRGRKGRNWLSKPHTGIWMSLLLKPDLVPEQVSSITLVTALAVANACDRLLKNKGIDLYTQIKWPNDILLRQKKICGILTEMSSERDYVHYIVVGIGINVNTDSFPESISQIATSVLIESGIRISRQEFIAAVLEDFSKYYQNYLQVGNLSALKEDYNFRLINRGRKVQVLYGMQEQIKKENIQTGTALGIDDTGALLVDTGKKTETVLSGEVTVRGIYGYI
jgi:BirA family biotin operon repressor/biotin-[acetyl-CoA-carboxylase] ligase